LSARPPTIDPSSEPPGRWATTVALSMGLHLAGFGLAVALPRLLPRGAQGPPVYVVDLVALPSPGAPGAPPPASRAPAPPQKKEITRPPVPEKTIKLPERSAKKAETKSKPPEPKKPEAKPSPTPAATDRGQEGATAEAPSPGATPAKGGAGGAGAGTGATAGVGAGQGGQADYYYTYLQGRIYAAWQRPLYPATETLRKSLTTTVRLTLSSSGRVTRAELVSSSGYGAIDQSVLRAVQDAQPFQPIPSSLGRESLTVNLEITLTPN